MLPEGGLAGRADSFVPWCPSPQLASLPVLGGPSRRGPSLPPSSGLGRTGAMACQPENENNMEPSDTLDSSSKVVFFFLVLWASKFAKYLNMSMLATKSENVSQFSREGV